jgi:hypothetical protein
MSSSLNSRIVDHVAPGGRRVEDDGCGRPPETPAIGGVASGRRRLLAVLAAWPLTALPALAAPDPALGLKRWGSGDFRRFGFLVYHATLWAGDDPQRPPLALRLDYKRTIAGSAIAEASVKEMRQLGAAEADLQRWGAEMARVFPDVRDGDHLTGLYRADGATFLFNGSERGEIADPEFARRFFAIWLDPRTSAPDLRAALLRRPAG